MRAGVARTLLLAAMTAIPGCDGLAPTLSEEKAAPDEQPSESKVISVVNPPKEGTVPKTITGQVATTIVEAPRKRTDHVGEGWIGFEGDAIYSRQDPDTKSYALWLLSGDDSPVRLIEPEANRPVAVGLDAKRVHYLRMPPYDPSKVYPDPEGPPVRIMELDRSSGRVKELRELRATSHVFRIREWFYIATAPGPERIPTPRAVQALSVQGAKTMPVYKYAGRLETFLELGDHVYWLTFGHAPTASSNAPGSIFRVPIAADGRPTTVPNGPMLKSTDPAPLAIAASDRELYVISQGRLADKTCAATLGRWNESTQVLDMLVEDICNPDFHLTATMTNVCWVADPPGHPHGGSTLYCYAPKTDALTLVSTPSEGSLKPPAAFGDGLIWSETLSGGRGSTYVATP